MSPPATPTRLRRAYFTSSIADFLTSSTGQVLGELVAASEFAVELGQRDAWLHELEVLRHALCGFSGRGRLYLEFVVPRLGKRIDAIVLIDHTIFVIEFKVGAQTFLRQDRDQVWDYALDLKNFHESIVVSSQAQRLKPHALDVRSSYYLEDVATEFHVQGLELDWTCVVWDADFRVGPQGWQHHEFFGNRWQRILKPDRQRYLKNAYRGAC